MVKPNLSLSLALKFWFNDLILFEPFTLVFLFSRDNIALSLKVFL